MEQEENTTASHIGNYIGLRTLEAWGYLFGSSSMINHNVSRFYYKLFFTIEHVVGYGNVIAKTLSPEIKNPQFEDLITLDVITRDFRWAFETIIYEQKGRKSGLVGSARDIIDLVRRLDSNSTKHTYK